MKLRTIIIFCVSLFDVTGANTKCCLFHLTTIHHSKPPQSATVSLKSGRNSYSRYYKMEHNKFYYKQPLRKISPFTFLRNGS